MVTITIGKLNDLAFQVPDYADLPKSSQDGTYHYGAKQYVNDGAAGVSLTVKDPNTGKSVRNPAYPDTVEGNKKFERDVLAACNARKNKMVNGTMGVRGAADPWESVAAEMNITVEQLRAAAAAASKKKAA